MRAIVMHQHGGPEVLVDEEIETPEAGPGQVRVKVLAVALNHLDLWVRGGLPGLKLPLPHILGSDIAGELPDGQRVLVNPGVSCMRCRECLTGRDNLCRDYKILGETTTGGYAEHVVVPAANILPCPGDLSPTDAASLPLTMLTAWQMLVDKAQVRPGEDVLVLGASAGVGVAAIQIAKLFGARVIATSRDADKRRRLHELGADDVLDTNDELARHVKKLTGHKGADVVFEHVGKATLPESIKACARGGRIVTCGATSGWDTQVDLRHVFFRQISLMGSTMGPKGSLFEILRHVEAGRLRPVVDRVMPLSQARQAHEQLARADQLGKIVLTVAA